MKLSIHHNYVTTLNFQLAAVRKKRQYLTTFKSNHFLLATTTQRQEALTRPAVSVGCADQPTVLLVYHCAFFSVAISVTPCNNQFF